MPLHFIHNFALDKLVKRESDDETSETDEVKRQRRKRFKRRLSSRTLVPRPLPIKQNTDDEFINEGRGEH